MKYAKIYLIIALLFLTGCASIAGTRPVQKMVADGAVPTLEDLVDTAFKGNDLVGGESLCATALPILEGLVEFSPNNADLLSLTSMAYTLYSFGFIEEKDPARARLLYAKGKEYGIRALKKRNAKFAKEWDKGDTDKALKCLNKDDVPTLFYTGLSWAFWTMLGIQDGEMTPAFDLPKILPMFDRVAELDESFFYGGAYLFYGAYYSQMPEFLGGGAEKSKAAFEKALAINDKFLATHFFYARYYATLVKDKELFDKELNYVFETPADVIPDWTLASIAVKDKARKLLEEREWRFE